MLACAGGAGHPELYTRSPPGAGGALGGLGGCLFAVPPKVAMLLEGNPGGFSVVHAGTAVARRRTRRFGGSGAEGGGEEWEELEPQALRPWKRSKAR